MWGMPEAIQKMIDRAKELAAGFAGGDPKLHADDDFMMEVKNPLTPRARVYDGAGSHFIVSTSDRKVSWGKGTEVVRDGVRMMDIPKDWSTHDVMHDFRARAIRALGVKFVKEERLAELAEEAAPIAQPGSYPPDNISVIPPRTLNTGT